MLGLAMDREETSTLQECYSERQLLCGMVWAQCQLEYSRPIQALNHLTTQLLVESNKMRLAMYHMVQPSPPNPCASSYAPSSWTCLMARMMEDEVYVICHRVADRRMADACLVVHYDAWLGKRRLNYNVSFVGLCI